MDTYIDQHETQAYGPFTVAQIRSVAVGIDPDFDHALNAVAGRLETSTAEMLAQLKRSGNLVRVTYTGASEGESDPVTEGRDALERLVGYVSSRKGVGKEIAAKVLNNESLSTAKRRRPVKLAGTLSTAITVIDDHRAQLPEADAWITELTDVRDRLNDLNEGVRRSRIDKKDMTPEVAAARAAWLTAYNAAKLQVEAVLKLHGRVELMPLIFDDLAEVHKTVGTTDDPPPDPSTTGGNEEPR